MLLSSWSIQPAISRTRVLQSCLSASEATRAGLLPLDHRDPFDRSLVAQAQAVPMPILSAGMILDRYDIKGW